MILNRGFTEENEGNEELTDFRFEDLRFRRRGSGELAWLHHEFYWDAVLFAADLFVAWA
jgi:hypothetical protein